MNKNVLFKNLEIKNTYNSVLLSEKDSNTDNDNASKTSSSDNKSKKKIKITPPVKESPIKEEIINNSISDTINSRSQGFRENECLNNLINVNEVKEVNIKRENNDIKYNCNKNQNEDFDKEKAEDADINDINLNIDLSSCPNININIISDIDKEEANNTTEDKLENKRVKNSIKNRAMSTFNLNLTEVKNKINDDTCSKAYPKSSRIEYKFLEDCSLKEARSSIFCKYEMSDFGKYYFNDILKLSSTNSNFDYNAVNRDINCFSTGTQSYGLQSRLNLENAFVPKNDKLKYLNNETNFPSLFPSTHILASQYNSSNKYNNEFIRKHQSSYNIFNINNNNIRNQGNYDVCNITNKEYDYNNEENTINYDLKIKGDSKTTNLINKNTLKISNDINNSNKNSNTNENKLYSDIDNSYYKISLNNKIILNDTNKHSNIDELNRESSIDHNKKKKPNKKIHFKKPDTEVKANYDTSDICNNNDNNNLNSQNRLLKKKSSQSMNDSYSSFSSTYSKNTQSCLNNYDNNHIIKDTNATDSEIVNAKYIFKSKLYSNSNNSSSNNNNKYVNKNNLSVCYNSLFTTNNNKSFNSSSSNLNNNNIINNAAEVNNSFNSSSNNSLNNKISTNTNINTNNTDLINISLQKSIYNSIKSIQDTEANNDCESGKLRASSQIDNNKSSNSIVNATDNDDNCNKIVNTKTNNNLNNLSNPDELDIDKLNQDFLSILTNLNNYYSINNESNKVLSPSKFKLDRNLKSYNSSLLMPGVSTENSSFKKDFCYKNNNNVNYIYNYNNNNNNKKKYSKFNTSQNITSFINLNTANVNVYNFELNRTINNNTNNTNNINNTNNNLDNIDNNRNNKYKCDYSHANQTININNKSSLIDSSHINIV